MRRLVLALMLGSLPLPFGTLLSADPVPTLDRFPFRESWGYVVVGEESAWRPDLPLSDLAYFSASINSWGELVSIPDVKRLRSFPGRKHLVVALLENQALTHLILHPGFAVRQQLLDDLVKAAAPFDGLQLDFESVSSRDKESFWSFLAELKVRLEGRLLSVAVPARTSLKDDAYDYRVLDRIVDRVMVMAYDEHWSGSAPGPVASVGWGKKVVQFAQSTVGPSRLILGVPFYGRAWTDRSLARAYRSPVIDSLFETKTTRPGRTPEGLPFFEYDELVTVKVYYEDRESQKARLDLYASLGVKNVAFWRLGQEKPDFWSLVVLLAPPPGAD